MSTQPLFILLIITSIYKNSYSDYTILTRQQSNILEISTHINHNTHNEYKAISAGEHTKQISKKNTRNVSTKSPVCSHHVSSVNKVKARLIITRKRDSRMRKCAV